jgi:hypothetical protein
VPLDPLRRRRFAGMMLCRIHRYPPSSQSVTAICA